MSIFMYQGKRIGIDSPLIADGVQYPNIRDPEVRTQLGIIELPDQERPQPEENYFISTDESGMEVYTLKPQEMIDAIAASKVAANVQALWQAAHDYEYAQISGTAVGLLVLGVSQSKPKALAVMAWSHAIWALYYSRKPTVAALADQTLLDFTSVGPIPHSIPELMAELGL